MSKSMEKNDFVSWKQCVHFTFANNDERIRSHRLEDEDRDVSDVDSELVSNIPTPLQMGKVYTRLIEDTMEDGEDYVDGIENVYNNDICKVIDNYNSSACYEPSYVIARTYFSEGF